MDSVTKSVQSFMRDPFRRKVVAPPAPSTISVAPNKDEPCNDTPPGVGSLYVEPPPPPEDEPQIARSVHSPSVKSEISYGTFKINLDISYGISKLKSKIFWQSNNIDPPIFKTSLESVISVSNKSDISEDESINDHPILKHILVNLLKEQQFPGPIYTAFTNMGYTTPEDFATIDLHELAQNNPQLNPISMRSLYNL